MKHTLTFCLVLLFVIPALCQQNTDSLINILNTRKLSADEELDIYNDISFFYARNDLELEFHGMITKKIFAELPPRSEYSITEAGRTLLPIIARIEKWGDDFRPMMKELLKIE